MKDHFHRLYEGHSRIEEWDSVYDRQDSSGSEGTMQWCSRLAELIGDWHYWIRNDGWRSALPAVLQDLARLPYRRFRFLVVARSLLEPLPDADPRISLEIREFRLADVELVRRMDRPSEAMLCARRLAHRHKGLLALHDGQPAGHAWGCVEVEPSLERVQLELEPGDFLCADAYTAPAFRGGGVQTALTLARFRLFRDMGYRRAVTYIDRYNAPSLAVWSKVGSKVVGQVDFIRIGPWRRVRYS